MQDYVSSYIKTAVFGSGNSSWVKNPEADPMHEEAKARGLKWGGLQGPGFYRVHYMHCGGIWVDRVRLEPSPHDPTRLWLAGNKDRGFADQHDAEWMLIPDDFPMPKPKEAGK